MLRVDLSGDMALQSVSMMSLPHGWRLSRHAEDQMMERAVAPSELVLCLAAPERRTPNPKTPDTSYWWHGSMGALVNEANKEVVTVLIDGANKRDWEEAARDRRASHKADAEALMALLHPRPRVQDRKPSEGRTARRKPQPVVQTRNVLANTSSRLYRTALKQAGGDPSRLRVRGPGRIEILPPTA